MWSLAAGVVALLFASNDNNVEWAGVSHVGWLDRRPVCPIDRESFDVRIQAFRFDLTGVRVFADVGSGWQPIDAVWVEDRGPYAIWQATIPPATSDTVSYYFELTDGADTDFYSVGGMSDNPPTDGGFVVDFATLSHAPLGATPTSDGGTVFRVWAPGTTNAWVRGEFNNWDLSNPMTRTAPYFVVRVPAAGVGQQYKFFFPASGWKPDARARALDPSQFNNSVITDPLAFVWSSGDFSPPALDDLIIYQMHVGTFAGRNDPVASGVFPATYLDVAAHVDHFVELGVNAVQLLPVTEFPTDASAGYNPITQWSPEWAYGSPDDLRTMIDTLHANGIAVILDIVWNHFSPTDNFLWFYDGTQIYFDDPAVDTPWGSQADFDNPRVREYFLESALHWVEHYRIDGFRMDSTEYMNIGGQAAAGWSLMQQFNDLLANRRADAIRIAEQLPDDPAITLPTSIGGAGFQSQWHDAFVDTLRQAILDAAFGDPSVSAVASVLDGSGPALEGVSVVNYFESHDEVWPASGGQRIVRTIDPTPPHDDVFAKGRTKLAQGLVFFSRGVPMIFMGTEWLEDTDFGTDPQNRIDWSKKTTYAPIFRYYKDVIYVRKTNAALKASAPLNVFHVNEQANVLAFHRWDGAGNDIVVVANFSNTNYNSYQLGFPQAGRWYELINSQSAIYDGNNLGNGGFVDTAGGPYDGFGQSATLTIPQMGLLVFRYNDPPCPGDLDGDGQINLTDLSTLLANFGIGGGATPGMGDLDGDGDVDLTDLSTLLGLFGTSCQ